MNGAEPGDNVVELALRAAQVGVWSRDLRTGEVEHSPEWRRELGLPPGDGSPWEAHLHPDDRERMLDRVRAYLADPAAGYHDEFRMIHADGSVRWMLARGELVRDADGTPARLVGGYVDITARKLAEAELARANRALRVLGGASQALVRLVDEPTVMAEICRVAVDDAGYRMAWVGYADDDGRVRPVASDGADAGYLGTVTITWRDDELGRGPAGTAIRTGAPWISRDIATDPALAPWREAAARHGYRSAIAIPLHRDGRTFGALSIYSGEPDAFHDGEVEVLTQLGRDLEVGVAALRARAERDAAARELEASRRGLQEAQAMAHVGHWVRELPAGRLTLSDEIYRIIGLRPQERPFTLDGFLALVHPEDRERVTQVVTRTGEAGGGYDITFRVVRPGGEVRHVQSRGEVRDDGAGGRRVFGVAQDVTERVAAQLELVARDRQLRTVLDHSPAAVFLCDAEGRIEYYNPRAVELWGRAPRVGEQGERFCGSLRLHHPDGTPVVGDDLVVARVLRTGAAVAPEEMIVERPDGSSVHALVSAVPLIGAEGKVTGAVCCIIDITERKRSEALLREREQEFRAFVENAPDLIARYDPQCRVLYVNPAMARAFGTTAQALLGRPVGDPAADRDPLLAAEVRRLVEQVVESGEPAENEVTWQLPTGRRSFSLRLFPETGADGAVTSVLGIARDVTELREAMRQVLALSENSPDLIARLDRDARYLYVNGMMETLTGIPAATLLGLRFGHFVAAGGEVPEPFLAARRKVAEVFDRCEPVETEITLLLATGERVFDLRLIPEHDEGGRVSSVLAVGRDVTDAKRAEAELRESEQRFRQLTEEIDEVFWLVDATTGKVEYVSPGYEKVWGRTRASLQASPGSWLDAVHPDDRERVREVAAGRRQGFEAEYRVVRPDGTVRWIHDRAVPVAGDDGRVYRVAGLAEDVTDRRELEEQLLQAQKMEAVGRLAGGVAHDFNNILAVIQMESWLLLSDAPLDDETREGIREIDAAAERAANLTRQLLTFSRRKPKEARDLDLAETVGTMLRLLRRVLGEDVTLETRFAPALPMVNADPGMVEQVLMNLAVNARDAMPGGGRLTVRLEPVRVDAARAAAHPGSDPGEYVCMEVADTGSGIAREHLSRIFEPFFTTKEPGRGTGLGLATVFGIAQEHCGWVEVESRPGEGTAFRVFLPALAAAGPAGAAAPAPERIEGGTETILVVEDEEQVRTLARMILTRFGYRVLEAGSAAAALKTWETEGASVDLLLTDLVMPGGMNGAELARRLQQAKPGLRVIYTSGYADESVERQLGDDPGQAFLQKPYSGFDLAARVRRALDA